MSSSRRSLGEIACTIRDVGISVGWIARELNSGAVRLIAPDGATLLLPPHSQFNQNKASTAFSKLMTHGERDKVRAWRREHGVQQPTVEQPHPEPMTQRIEVPSDLRDRVSDTPAPVVQLAPATPPARPGTSRPGPVPVSGSPGSGPKPVASQPSNTEPRAGAGGDTPEPIITVHSSRVLKRAWPDGHVDFMCRYCAEDYVNPRAASVGAHHSHSPGHPGAKVPPAGRKGPRPGAPATTTPEKAPEKAPEMAHQKGTPMKRSEAVDKLHHYLEAHVNELLPVERLCEDLTLTRNQVQAAMRAFDRGQHHARLLVLSQGRLWRWLPADTPPVVAPRSSTPVSGSKEQPTPDPEVLLLEHVRDLKDDARLVCDEHGALYKLVPVAL